MSWKVRHQGSPQSMEVADLAQVLHGIENGQWEPTDEVQGPGESAWVPIENHPQLTEVAAELEPPPRVPEANPLPLHGLALGWRICGHQDSSASHEEHGEPSAPEGAVVPLHALQRMARRSRKNRHNGEAG